LLLWNNKNMWWMKEILWWILDRILSSGKFLVLIGFYSIDYWFDI
jgi:hypothetical protein